MYEIEVLFGRFLVLQVHRGLEFDYIFEFELSLVPPSLIDEYGLLRKGVKAIIVKMLSVILPTAAEPDHIIVDAGQLLYKVVWPVDGTIEDIASSCAERLSVYSPHSTKQIIFDRYEDIPSAKDHERERRGTSKEVMLSLNTPLPSRDTVLHNKKNKTRFSNLLCTFPLPNN